MPTLRKFDQLQPVDAVIADNGLLTRFEIREYQDLVSGTSCDQDDELLDPPELEAFGIHEVQVEELQRWSLMGDIGMHDD